MNLKEQKTIITNVRKPMTRVCGIEEGHSRVYLDISSFPTFSTNFKFSLIKNFHNVTKYPCGEERAMTFGL